MLTLDSNRYLVLGHRGASAHAPENSEAAFRLAAIQGADGVELDVRRTGDGLLVVHHDAVISSGRAIVDLTSGELRQRQPSIASFDDAMAACDGLLVNVEIKNSPLDPDFDSTDRVAEEVVRWIIEHDWTDRVVISSFNTDTVDRVRELSDVIATGQLIERGNNAFEQLRVTHERGHQALHPPIGTVTNAAELAAAAAGLGMWVLAWTVDDPGTIVALREAGLTGIITNDPAGAVTALAQ